MGGKNSRPQSLAGAKERQQREQRQREQQQREQRQREQQQREKQQREKQQREQQQREQQQREQQKRVFKIPVFNQREQQNRERERQEQQQREKKKQEDEERERKKREENERQERERRERLERERLEQERLERERQIQQNINGIATFNINSSPLPAYYESMTSSIMNDEESLLQKINQFNTYYARYIHCNNINVNSGNANKSDNCEIYGTFTNPTTFSGNKTYNSTVITGNAAGSYNSIESAAYADQMAILAGTRADPASNDTINGLINKITNNIRSGEPNISGTEYIQNVENIDASYNKIISLRQDLDNKLNELYVHENSISNSYKQQYDSTIYSGILLSALATSLLYYLFKEM